MKSNTMIHIAIRNIGNAQDGGQFFNGTVRDSIYWLVERIGEISIADRIAIGIGRDRTGAERGIMTQRNSGMLDQGTRDILDSLFANSEDGAVVQPAIESNRSPLDDYQAPGQ